MQKINLLLISSCILVAFIQTNWAHQHEFDVNQPSVFENADQFLDDYERNKRGNYKLVKIELEKFKEQNSDKTSCDDVVSKSPTLNLEIKKGFDLEKLSKSSSTELLNKFQSLLDHLYFMKSDHDKFEPHGHGPCKHCKSKANEFEYPKNAKALYHRQHYDFEDDREFSSNYYASKHDKHPHYHHHEEKHSYKKPETTIKKTTSTEKPYKYEKETPKDPYYLHMKKVVDDYNPKKAYVEKKTPKYESSYYEKETFDPKNSRFEAKKEKTSKYVEPYFYEKPEEPKKTLKPFRKEQTKDPYYAHEKSYVKANYEEHPYKKPTVTKPNHKQNYEDHYYDTKKPITKPSHEKYPAKHSFEVVYSNEDPYYHENFEKKYVPKVPTEKPTYRTTDTPTPKPHKTHKESYPEPYYEFVKYLKKDYVHRYFADMTDYVHHGGKSDCKDSYETKKSNDFPVSYHPNRYESLKRPDSPVADSTRLLKSLAKDDWPLTVPVNTLKLQHSCKDKPRHPLYYKSDGYLTKRKADVDNTEEDIIVKKEEVPEWVETKVVDDAEDQEEDTENEFDVIRKAEGTAEYDHLVDQIKSEMVKIEQELMKQKKDSTDNKNPENNDVHANYDTETNIDRFKRSLFKKEQRKKDVFENLKPQPSKKDVFGNLFKSKKEKEKTSKFKSLFPSEKPKKKGLFSFKNQ